MSLHTPLADLGNWQLTSEPVTLPPGLRYGGYEARALRAQRGGAGAAGIHAPLAAAVRVKSVAPAGTAPGLEVLELEPLAFLIRPVAQACAAGLPTFYFLLPSGTAPGPADQQAVATNELLATASDLRLVVMFPDRLPREPALWSDLLLQAIVGAGADADQWQPFVTAVTAADARPDAPVLVMDHAGRPLQDASLQVTVGGTMHPVTFTAADHGDLQAAIARLHAADPGAMPLASLWSGGTTSATLAVPTGDGQLGRVEDGVSGAGSIGISPAARHVMLTDLEQWFAPQFAGPALARYRRGNRFTPLVNGHATFDDLFARLNEARVSAAGAFHLAGWSLFAEEELATRPAGAPAEYPLTIAQAATVIGAADDGACRFLAVDFLQISDPDKLEAIETLALFILVAVETMKRAPGIADLRDGSGLVLAFAVLLANPFITTYLKGEDFKTFEPNQDAIDTLAAIMGSAAFLSPLPFTVADNPLADLGGIVFGAGGPLFDAVEKFGVYHQKLAVVRRDAGFVGYCGGIDCNPNRLDDHRHLAASPYHDVHARIEGPAVEDLAITFEQRWDRDGGGVAPAFTAAAATVITSVGSDVVQVARTYGSSAAPARQLGFAPGGDRTLLDTVLSAIAQAREFIYIEDQYLTPPAEYLDVLLAKVASGDLRKLIILAPDIADQPFGDIRRSAVIDALRAAAAAAGKPDMVRIGSPRRRFTVPHAPLRGSSGRLMLKEDITSSLTGATAIALGPPARIPPVPFWLAVDGELMWVYDESTLPNPDPANMRMFQVERGDTTRIVSGAGGGKGASAREHKSGAAATLVHLDGIYVHAKLMIVDDVFLSVGSANLNRRGFYSDGECNLMTVPEGLRASPDNPVRALRKQLWAEVLDLPPGIGDPLLEDPIAASALFERSYFLGNRYVEAEAFPKHVMIHNFAGGDGLVGTILNHLGIALLAGSQLPLFDTVVDPSSGLDPHAP
jgi:phosphatidylserine/phosphatidylglycerophosphate/cardiolipin synthase-like enzyme